MNEYGWTFGGLEFRMLMEHVGRDRLPYPIQFRPTADSAADYHRSRHEASTAVERVLDDDLRSALHVVLSPVVRIEVAGHAVTGRAQPSPTVKIRAHAALGHDVAVVLTQEPGSGDLSGGPVRLDVMEPHRAVGRALAAMPDAPAGRTTRIDVERPDEPARSAESLLRNVHRTRDEQRYDALFSRNPSCAGEILVCPGSATDSRSQPGTTGLQWVDFSDDGRYVIRHSTVISVLPASPTELAGEVRTLVDRAVSRR